MRHSKIIFTALVLALACVGSRGQGTRKSPLDKDRDPSVKLTASVQTIAMPTMFNRFCIARFYESHPDVGRMEKNNPVTLRAEALDMGPGPLKYSYQVSGGRIVGEGTSAKWDLTGVQPGTYTATVEVENERGTTSFASTTATISEFHCESEWFGVKAELSCSVAEVPAGKPATVSARVEGAPPDAKIGYEWQLSAGSIRSGQGTPSITIDTAGMEGQAITVTVQLKGMDLAIHSKFSCTFVVAPPAPRARKMGEFGPVNEEEMMARVDAYLNELNTEPSAQGYIISYSEKCKGQVSGPGELARARHVDRMMRNYLRRVKRFAFERIVFVKGCARDKGVFQLYVVPTGANPPSAEQD